MLGGHSLGGAVVTAYATWNFGGHAGADDLGGPGLHRRRQLRRRVSAAGARPRWRRSSRAATPWLNFGGIAAPFAGLFSATGPRGAARSERAARSASSPGCCRLDLKPPVPVTNLGQYGYALNVGTSPASLIAAQAHLGKGITTASGCTAGTAPAR